MTMKSFPSRTFKSGSREAGRPSKVVVHMALVERLDALPKPAEIETRDQEAIPEPLGL